MRFRRHALVILGSICLAGACFGDPASAAANNEAPAPAALRAAIAKSLPLLDRSAATTIEERSNCFTCHNTGLPVMALIAARQRGFEIDPERVQRQIDFTAAFLAKNRQRYLEGKGQGGQALTAGSALLTLELGAWKPDATTDAVTSYLLTFQKDLPHWRPQTVRPPAEESLFATSYAALRGLKIFGTPADASRIAHRTAQVREWTLNTPAANTEDRVFRLWSLHLVEAPREALQAAADELLAAQRPDGGWPQLPTMASDAYATATALAALHDSMRLTKRDSAFARGLQWLLADQRSDGSWHVRTRSHPIQSYFESGYPHGKDQFISITAAAWATTVLAQALDE